MTYVTQNLLNLLDYQPDHLYIVLIPKRKETQMSHGLEIIDGNASFVTLREPAWHGLGHVITEPLPLTEMMTLAKVNGWNVRLESIADAFPHHHFNQDRYLVVRDNPADPTTTQVLGFVGSRFHVIQNEDMFQFCENLLHGVGTWETMGSINDGAKVFGCMSMDVPDIVIDPQGAADVVKNYLMCTQGHDGTGALVFGLTPTRVVCQNTLNFALRGLRTRYSIKHTPGQQARREDCQRILGISLKFNEALAEEAAAMFAKSVTDQQFDDLIKAAYPLADDAEKAATTKWDTKRDLIWDIYKGPTCTTIKGTAWCAFNALTERLDWGRKARKGDNESVLVAGAGLDDVITKEKDRIYSLVQSNLMQVVKPKRAKVSA